jgi:hypothetical protein
MARTSNKTYEDDNFIAGDSPVVHDIFADLGHYPVSGYIICDGAGDILIQFSQDGTNYGDQITMKSGEKIDCLAACDVNKIKITHSSSDSAYRIMVY